MPFGNASGAVPPIDILTLTRQGSITLTRPSLKNYIATKDIFLARMTQLFGWIQAGKVSF